MRTIIDDLANQSIPVKAWVLESELHLQFFRNPDPDLIQELFNYFNHPDSGVEFFSLDHFCKSLFAPRQINLEHRKFVVKFPSEIGYTLICQKAKEIFVKNGIGVKFVGTGSIGRLYLNL